MPGAQPASLPSAIRLTGVRQNNLKGFNLDIPLNKLVVVTGLSGAGKSSLVFETLHAEGQRRYVETFSPYTRQFLDRMDRPEVDAIENIRPSIAIEQSNTVKTTRSTVGTMTELCDYFKVWFRHSASLHDPATGEIIRDDNPQTIWQEVSRAYSNQTVLVTFPVSRPGQLTWQEIIDSLSGQGYTRLIENHQVRRLDAIDAATLPADATLHIIQDRIKTDQGQQGRFIEAAQTALRHGRGQLAIHDAEGKLLKPFSEGLHSPVTGRRFRPPIPALFSFNSPIGACPRCRGFGRIIEIDYRLAIPDETLTLRDGAIRPFQGKIYGESLRDLTKAAKRHGIRMDVPWNELTDEERHFVMEGEPGYGEDGREWPEAWYGLKRFFSWLESQAYKMHVRVFLAKYRAYMLCPDCQGKRLQPEALLWRWRGHTLPDLYQLPVSALLDLLRKHAPRQTGNHPCDLAIDGIISRLHFIEQVGLGYLTLDRSSRSLSGGEVERVNLTTCLGSALVDTLFVLDEPSVGLHARDMGQLITILRRLVDLGNTVVVVEHDEAVMRAADHIIEVGPKPGRAGGNIVFSGEPSGLIDNPASITGGYLSGRLTVDPPAKRRPVVLKSGRRKSPHPLLHFKQASLHNIRNLSLSLPLERLVAISGVSGSGKSTLLNGVIYQGLLAATGKAADQPASIKSITGPVPTEIVLVDQSPVSRTPRSNPALYVDAWDGIRNLFAGTESASAAGMTAAWFSFNTGQGRCDHCQGLGYERIEMQFLSDLFVTCPVCEGKRFKPEVLAITWSGKSVAEVLAMDINQACVFFAGQPAIRSKLEALRQVGLGYLTLGQPLNTLSGGEAQRLKLVRYLSRIDREQTGALLLLDEPTTGLHRDDVKRLLVVLQSLVAHGHSVIVIEHQTDVLAAADWIIEMGPEAGDQGGNIVAEGTPETIATGKTVTAPYLAPLLNGATEALPLAAEAKADYTRSATAPLAALQIKGAREHNLRDLNVTIPHHAMVVLTGVSGSGKSSLAFDIIFAEGQRRFMESMSAYARQFVEQMPRPEVDSITGIAPTVAIEQRVTRGSAKSTVATITEVAQYLRLLYARVGVAHSVVTGEPLIAQSPDMIRRRLASLLKEKRFAKAKHLYFCAPVIRSRKGHHQPVANWARDHGYTLMRVDGQLIETASFEKLDRYREHDIDVVVADFGQQGNTPSAGSKMTTALEAALRLGKGSAFLLLPDGSVPGRFSTTRTDPATGEAYPDLDPKHFSWNSPRGWCPACRGHGYLVKFNEDDPGAIELPGDPGDICPDCHGERLNPISRAVRLPLKGQPGITLPALLALPPAAVLQVLENTDLDARGKRIMRELLPEIKERLRFMDQVGLGYLTLERATSTLSGGEAQRIRLAAQMGSNLSGVLYVLDEPSIGLHARDNNQLIQSLLRLRDKGNTVLVVEHDENTMRAADLILDLGPGAGVHGGHLVAQGPATALIKEANSLTGRYLKIGIKHPLRGQRRPLPKPPSAKGRPSPGWMSLREMRLRNLKGDDLHLPLGRLSVFCGISGAGKSTCVRGLLKPLVSEAIAKREARLLPGDKTGVPPKAFKSLVNGHAFDQVIEVDQEPIGKTPRSTPATYIGAFDIIRQHFASLPDARIRGWGPGHFSFNTKGGRCETCQGAGRVKLEMNFLPDTYVTCEDCGGRRYGPELESLRWNDRSIADVLKMSFEEAAAFFAFNTTLSGMLNLMVETGLGYLTLGQSSPTLSGGEAQRLKLVSELIRGLPGLNDRRRGKTPNNLYLLEEPTIGLHTRDCERLIELLHRLVDQGHTVVVIEHNLDVIAEADYVVELGPEGGEAGGHVLFQGEVEALATTPGSPTAPYLRAVLNPSKKRPTRQIKKQSGGN